jgi:hypothetical protein
MTAKFGGSKSTSLLTVWCLSWEYSRMNFFNWLCHLGWLHMAFLAGQSQIVRLYVVAQGSKSELSQKQDRRCMTFNVPPWSHIAPLHLSLLIHHWSQNPLSRIRYKLYLLMRYVQRICEHIHSFFFFFLAAQVFWTTLGPKFARKVLYHSGPQAY